MFTLLKQDGTPLLKQDGTPFVYTSRDLARTGKRLLEADRKEEFRIFAVK